MSDFDRDCYLSNLPAYLKKISKEGLKTLLAECDDKLCEHRENYAHCLFLVDRWRTAWQRYKRGERKTKPYPLYGGVDLQYAREKCGQWTAYWLHKREMLEAEIAARGGGNLEGEKKYHDETTNSSSRRKPKS